MVESDIEAEKLEAKRNKLKWIERFPVCPVCRVPMGSEIINQLNAFTDMSSSSKAVDIDEIPVISDKMRSLQIKMKEQYERQKLAGGIIESKEQEIIVLNVCLFHSGLTNY